MVSGRVTDARTGLPVAGALVAVSVDKGVPRSNEPAKSAPSARSDGNGQFLLPERSGLGLFSLLGDPPIHHAIVRISKAGYVGFTTTQVCNGSDGEPSMPVHVFAMLKPASRGE